MAKKKRAPAATRAKRQKAIDRSVKEVTKAQRNLELKLKQHKRVVSAMFFAI
jgi:hypothetical protein